MGKSRKRLALFLVAAFIAAIAMLLYAAFLNMSQAPKPASVLSEGNAFESHDNALFKYEINRYSSKAEVSNISGRNISVGVSTDTKDLDFGIIPAGGSFSDRFVTLSNMNDDGAVMQLRAYGSIAPFVEFEKNDFALGPKGSVSVRITFRTVKGMSHEAYGGEIDIITRRPKYAILKGFE